MGHLFFLPHPEGATRQLSRVHPAIPFSHSIGSGPKGRAQRVGVFNFGTDRVRVLEKMFLDGSGMDRVRVFASYI